MSEADKSQQNVENNRNNKLELKNKKLKKRRLSSKLKGSRYLVPNLVTVGSIFCGFLAIVYSTSGRYEKAVFAIAFAIVLDGLDGRVARRLNATSKFGLEFDSLCDLVSFGIAPAILVYNWCFRVSADEFGVAICFIYAVCVATRLARFNIIHSDSINFAGLPSPAGAGAIIAMVNVSPFMISSKSYITVVTVLTLIVSFSMVSTIEYLSIKKIKLNDVSFGIPLIVSLLIGLLWYNNRIGFMILAMGYVFTGPVVWAYKFMKGNKGTV